MRGEPVVDKSSVMLLLLKVVESSHYARSTGFIQGLVAQLLEHLRGVSGVLGLNPALSCYFMSSVLVLNLSYLRYTSIRSLLCSLNRS